MTRARAHRGAARMHGGVSVLMAVLIGTVALAALVSVDIGHLFYRQRQLQAADLAALAAAQQLRRVDSDAALHARALEAGAAAAVQNGHVGATRADCGTALTPDRLPQAGEGSTPKPLSPLPPAGEGPGERAVTSSSEDGMSLCVGLWNPRDTTTNGGRHFRADYDPTQTTPNAVRVVATRTIPILFGLRGGPGRQLRAEAIATASPPVAAFSVGSGLADFDSARSVLSLLLGHAVRLSAVDWQGLVDSRVTLEQLRLRAGAGTVDALLRTTLSLSDFYALVLGAADRATLLTLLVAGLPAQVDQAALAAGLSVGRVVDLGVLAPSASSAADVGLGVAELLMLAAQVANANAAVDLSASVPLLPGARLVARIGEPPRMAVGPVQPSADSPSGWKTAARTAQAGLGLYLPLGASLPVGGTELSGSIELALHVEAARAQSALTGLRCAANPSDRRAMLSTTSAMATVCLADKTDLGRCATDKVQLGKLDGLGLAKAVVSAYPQQVVHRAQPVDSTLAPGATDTVASPAQLATLLADVASNLDVELKAEILGMPLPALRLKLGGLLDVLGQAIGGMVGPAAEGLLAMLGIRLGTADLWVHDVECDNTNLVY
ncbi:putative membrane protein [Cupriavidus gilardii J11]|uniref:Putative membrane protein n=1 Tax=Cupriavidus gilardii J11 TaxID=936133 RepID=A0A562B9E2_9BURK|nr:TadG family pilus assembly protein [Cupriavidus gilardii]TWG81797.1 putative membrane protein [Cupriavidus gilardii J11]